MSLSAALAAYNITTTTRANDNGDASSSSSVYVPSLTHSVSSTETDECSSLLRIETDTTSVSPSTLARRNEHLAVLLPKQLWKPDSLAAHCDTFYCQIRFTLFERRHHCRKCGGVFCAACSSRSTPLLDTSNLSFLHPPRNTPISVYDSAQSPVTTSRVCEDCYEQLQGQPSPTPDVIPTSPISLTVSSETSSLDSSLNTPPNSRCIFTKRRLPPVIEAEPSFGELDAYPLRRSSALCKATGGGRWEPKPCAPAPGSRIPCGSSASWGKAPFEVDMEREEEAERLRQLNPIVRDGDFQYRFARQYDHPCMDEITSYMLSSSTF